jgi:6-pyruvoyltetrahydropterin/6-carboxytetrahydropterin synthase
VPFHVRVEGNRLRFMSAHMATWQGACEPLHGHNYRLSVEVEGALTDDSWVIDFSTLKRIAREICETLDHRFLLQRDSRVLAIMEAAEQWEIVAPGGRRYLLPKADVMVLPIDNTTTERLAAWFHSAIGDVLRRDGMDNVSMLRVEVEEAPGQSSSFAAPLDHSPNT